jgi:CrcB protein
MFGGVLDGLLLAGVSKTFFLTSDPVIRASIAISLGAIPGALSRYYLTVLLARWFGTAFPFGTFFINLTGAGLMGFFATLTSRQANPSPDLHLLIAVGFLGAYTTFSTYALDTSNLLRTKDYRTALFYWAGSPILGFLCLELGVFLAKSLP